MKKFKRPPWRILYHPPFIVLVMIAMSLVISGRIDQEHRLTGSTDTPNQKLDYVEDVPPHGPVISTINSQYVQ